MLIKLFFYSVYTSPFSSATLSDVSFFSSQIAKELRKGRKQFYFQNSVMTGKEK